MIWTFPSAVPYRLRGLWRGRTDGFERCVTMMEHVHREREDTYSPCFIIVWANTRSTKHTAQLRQSTLHVPRCFPEEKSMYPRELKASKSPSTPDKLNKDISAVNYNNQSDFIHLLTKTIYTVVFFFPPVFPVSIHSFISTFTFIPLAKSFSFNAINISWNVRKTTIAICFTDVLMIWRLYENTFPIFQYIWDHTENLGFKTK